MRSIACGWIGSAIRFMLGLLSVIAMIVGTFWMVLLVMLGAGGIVIWSDGGRLLLVSCFSLATVIAVGLLSYHMLFMVLELCMGWREAETGWPQKAQALSAIERDCRICAGLLLVTCAIWRGALGPVGDDEIVRMTAAFAAGYAIACAAAYGIQTRENG